MKKFISLATLAVLVISLYLPFMLPMEAEAQTFPGYNGKIAFYSNRDGDYEIYVMDADGSNQTRLTNAVGQDYTPKWSPDGSKIVFYSLRDGNYELYIMDADGSNQTNLSNNPGYDHSPHWSPDGTKIVFYSDRTGDAEIYLINADGSNLTRLTNAVGNDYSAVWSPDGTKIVFSSSRDGNREIYVMDADGSNQTRLTNNPGFEEYPAWNSDGTKIVFDSERDGFWDIWSMDANGSNQTNLTNASSVDDNYFYTHISPDRMQLAFIECLNAYESCGVATSNIDGSNRQLVIGGQPNPDAAFADWVIWSPDGKRLATTFVDDQWNYDPAGIYISDTDGSGLELTTPGGSVSYATSWQPIPNMPPVVTNDSANVSFETSKLIDVIANDTDEEALSGSNLDVTVQPTNGSASIVDGNVQYTPSDGYVGLDSLTYEICDSFMLDQQCETGVLNLTVKPAVAVSMVAGTGFSEGNSGYSTASLRPTFSGTATPGSEITVEIHSDPIILTTTADSNGNWSVTPTFDLPSGQHMVYISATLNGLTTSLGSFGLMVGSLASTGESVGVALLGGVSLLAGGVWLLYRQRQIRVVEQ